MIKARAFSLPPENRLKRRSEFLKVQRNGRRVWGKRFIFFVHRAASEETRIGITVSRKVGNAVVRNRIKRWVREVFRTQEYLFKRPVDIVVIAKKDIDDYSFSSICDEFIHVFTRYFEGSSKHKKASGHPKGSVPTRGSKPRSAPQGDTEDL